MALWKLVAQKNPKDKEASKKANDLAASQTIAKGRYDQAASGEAPTPVMKDPAAAARTSDDGDGSNSMAAQRVAKDAAAFLQRIEETPNNPAAYLSLAQLYRRNDFPDKAREVLKKGLTATKNNFDLAMEATDLDIEPFRRDLASTEEKLRTEPKNADLAAIRGKLMKEINTRELAFYRQKSDRYPTDSVARYEMAVRLYKAAQYEEAIEQLQKVRTDPKHKTRVLIYLGFCFKGRNNWNLAKRNFEEAMQAPNANRGIVPQGIDAPARLRICRERGSAASRGAGLRTGEHRLQLQEHRRPWSNSGRRRCSAPERGRTSHIFTAKAQRARRKRKCHASFFALFAPSR